MEKIRDIWAIEILDSRGNPTLEVFIASKHEVASAKVPSGASTGLHEAKELRDEDPKRYQGKGVLKAISRIPEILPRLKEMVFGEQEKLDHFLIPHKERLGANTILGISLAYARLSALLKKTPLYRHLSLGRLELPCPMMNVINGGVHADSGLPFQEFMIRPHGIEPFADKIRAGAEIFHTLKSLLKKRGDSISVGDEGGFAPKLKSNEEALDLLVDAIQKAGYTPGSQVSIALDPAASEFYKDGHYHLGSKKLTSKEMIRYLEKLISHYPIDSIEDGLDQEDWAHWPLLTSTLHGIQIVGDDLYVTNPKFLKRGIEMGASNAILIKLNQIGTLTETIEAIQMAKKAGFKTIISHRSGETEDTFIADLAVAAAAGQIKTGSLCRSERIAKYNRLLEIEYELKN